jgi:hypothetical protein
MVFSQIWEWKCIWVIKVAQIQKSGHQYLLVWPSETILGSAENSVAVETVRASGAQPDTLIDNRHSAERSPPSECDWRNLIRSLTT